MELTGARRCGSLPARSNETPSGRISIRRAEAHRLVGVAVGVDRCLPTRRRRAAAPRARRACAARCSRAAPPSRPRSSRGRGGRRAPRAGARPSRSPRSGRGSRPPSRASSGSAPGSARRRRRRSCPPSTTLTGGMITPSWNTSRKAPIDAGAPPPTSTWWARFATYPSSSPSANTGEIEADVVEVHAARERLVGDDHVAGAEVLGAVAADRLRHLLDHRAEVHGLREALRHRPQLGVEEGAGEVGARLDVRRVGAARAASGPSRPSPRRARCGSPRT